MKIQTFTVEKGHEILETKTLEVFDENDKIVIYIYHLGSGRLMVQSKVQVGEGRAEG